MDDQSKAYAVEFALAPREVVAFEDLKGTVLRDVRKLDGIDGPTIVIQLEDGRSFKLYHSQDCCECVSITDIAGDLSDLVGPVLLAEESSREAGPGECSESGTWTFYRIGTIKGSVAITWLGTSNGYYSERVYFEQTMPKGE